MDGNRFDDMSRRLAAGVSRREALRRIVGGAIGGSLALTGLRRVGAATKVWVCHQTGSATNPFNYIEVSENAVPAHAAHGDATYVNLMSDVNNCGACGNVCGGDACSTAVCQGGVCGTVAVVCDDGNACTSDTCDVAQGGCVYTVSGGWAAGVLAKRSGRWSGSTTRSSTGSYGTTAPMC